MSIDGFFIIVFRDLRNEGRISFSFISIWFVSLSFTLLSEQWKQIDFTHRIRIRSLVESNVPGIHSLACCTNSRQVNTEHTKRPTENIRNSP